MFAEYGQVFDGALKESFVSFVLIFLLFFFLIPSSDVFDCEHVPYSTRMHSTNNSLAGKKKRKENFSSQRDKRRKVLEASCIIALEEKNERICTMEHILLVMAYNGSVTVIWGLSRGK